ncbi:N-acetyltransferase, partial [Xanthomonas vasicola]
GGNCKKPAFSVANTGSFSTPVQTSRPCGRWVVGVFQGRLIRSGALLCSGVHIGADSIIGHNTIIRARANIGTKSVISHLVCLERDANIGNNVRISALTHITGNCFVGDNVQIGARVVTINDNEMRWRAGEILRAPKVLSGARIGSGVTLLGHVTIGENAFIGAGSVVTRNIPEGTLAYGNPAYVQGDRPMGEWLAGASRQLYQSKEEI